MSDVTTELAIEASDKAMQIARLQADNAGEDMTVTARDYFIGDGEYCLDLEFHEVFTPEQAIAATLGSCNCSDNCTNSERTGTCHEIEDEDTGFIVCSECGAVHDESYTAYYCWCCGRRIVQ